MNRGQARTRARLYLNERSAAQWSDSELDDLLLAAEREVFEEIVSARGDLFTKVARFNWAANTFSIDLSATTDTSSAALGDYWKILGVFTVPDNADAGRTNMPNPLYSAVNLVDLYIDAKSNIGDRLVDSTQWLEHGGNLYMNPVPSSDRYIWIVLMPKLNVTGSDSHVLLSIDGGSSSPIVEAHDLVAMLAAIKASSSVNAQPGLLAPTYTRRLKSLLKLLQSSANSMEPRRVGR